ncbi:MAG: DUF2029 domain-containing protein [Methanomassiliicoccaceae archaeon]|nr:DUF2029 domain-containing protein [Methanomassiliicoccaceae archaeon]
MVTVVDRIGQMYRKEYERNPVFTLFLTILIAFFIVFVIAAVVTGGDSIHMVFLADKRDTFMDHFNSIKYSSDHPYTRFHVIYPPLVTSFYTVLGYLTIPFVDVASIEELAPALRSSQMGIMSFLIITLVTFYALYLIFSRIVREEGIRKELMFLFAVLLAYPFVYALERGNSIIMALVFCLLFILGHKSENKYVRYASYIALGCAAGIKLYPAILWLLILKDRNYREAGICAAIVAVLVFVPFVFTDGSPLIFFDKVFSYASANPGFTNLNQIITGIFGEWLGLSEGGVSVISYAVIGTFTLLSFIVILFDKEMKFWKVLALIGCNLVLGLGIGAQYQIIYMTPAILYFLASEKNMTRENLFYVVCFAMTMVLIPGLAAPWLSAAIGVEAYPSAVIGAVESFFVIVIAIALLREGIVRIYRGRSAAHGAEATA